MADPYIPNLTWPPAQNVGRAGFSYGHGSPEGVVYGDHGDYYIDEDAPAIYEKQSNGSTTDWAIVASTGGGGGTQEMFQGNGSPEGVQAAPVGNHWWDKANKGDWVKDSGSGNTGWLLLSGNPPP